MNGNEVGRIFWTLKFIKCLVIIILIGQIVHILFTKFYKIIQITYHTSKLQKKKKVKIKETTTIFFFLILNAHKLQQIYYS